MPGTATPNGGDIDELIVTATRRPVDRREISSAISLVSHDAVKIEKLVIDALSAAVGVSVQQTTPGQGAAVIRGLKGSAILHLVDGMRLNNAIFRNAPTQYFALIPTSAVERIELIRGTPTSLYGSDAVGGVVQLVTHVPKFESSETNVRGELMTSFSSAELEKSIRGTVDIGNNTVASSFSAEYLETGNRRTGGGERLNPSGYQVKAARGVLVATPTNDQSWLLDVHYLEQPETPRIDELVPGFGQTQPSSSEFFFEPNRRLFVHGRYTRETGPFDLDWNLDVAWQRLDDDRRTRDYQANERQFEFNRSDLYGATLSGVRINEHGSWIVGTELYHDRVGSSRLEENLITGLVDTIGSRFPNGSTIRQASVYSNINHALSERHRLSGGLRYSYEKVKLESTQVSNATSVSNSDVSGDFGWVFNVRDNWQLVANVGFGFRAPNVFDLGTLGNRPGNRFNIPNTNLDSEHVLQADFGFRYRTDRLAGGLMLYALKYDDRITSVGTGNVTPNGRDIVQSVNAAESIIRGIEGGLDFEISKTIKAGGVLNYTWGEQDVTGQASEAADRIPPLSGRLTLTWEPGGSYRIATWMQFAGKQDRLSSRDVRDVRINPDGTAGWTILGTRLSWDYAHNWQVSFDFDNVFDKSYREHGSGLDAPGLNAAISLRHRF